MIWYKTNKENDPYSQLWSREEWLYPIENAYKMEFPLIITVEPTNACQNRCLYCSRWLMNRKMGFMSLETMETSQQTIETIRSFLLKIFQMKLKKIILKKNNLKKILLWVVFEIKIIFILNNNYRMHLCQLFV